MREFPASVGHSARGIPTLLDLLQAEEHHELGPLPLLAGTSPPPAPFWEKGKGQGVPAREGVPAHGFLGLWAVWAWEYHERGPLSSRDRLPLLIHGHLGALQKNLENVKNEEKFPPLGAAP